MSGVGDEARCGADWVTARRGDVVVLLRLGAAARATASATLVGLARAAVDRLPATVAPGG